MKNKLAIIIVNYNGTKDTIDCVNSINSNCTIKNLEIIIVDNASNIENRTLLIEKLSNNKIILNEENSGFAIANNIGIKYAMDNNYENILLLNNDTLITKNSLESMLTILESHEELGAVSCSILYNTERNKIWFDGGYINWNRYISIHENEGKIYCKSKEIRNVEFISGCCLMIKRCVISSIGYLPKEYFMYFEDTDFCVKILEAGYKMAVDRSAVIYHKVSASSGGEESVFSIEWGTRNRIIFMKKFKYKSGNSFNYFKSKIFFYGTRLIKGVNYLFKGDFDKNKALIRGVLNGIKYNKENENK